MDGRRFDEFTRSLAGRATRRRLLGGAAAGALGGLLTRLGARETAAACTRFGLSCTGAVACCNGAACLNGVCRCPAGTAMCNTLTGPSCVPACPADQVMGAGCRCLCATSGRPPGPTGCACPTGLERCNGKCVDPRTAYQSDPANCGGCGIDCGPCRTCDNRVCSAIADGTPCATGQVCHAGTCEVGCFIDGVFYTDDALNPTNACQCCMPTVSTTSWTNEADPDPCDDGNPCTQGEFCQDGACGGGSPVTAGAPCGDGAICDGAGNCSVGCGIGGTFYAPKALNPDNQCQWCDPAIPIAWTNVPDPPNDPTSTGCTVECCTFCHQSSEPICTECNNFCTECPKACDGCFNCNSYYGGDTLMAGYCSNGICGGPFGFVTRR